MTWTFGDSESPRKPYHAIKCLTCQEILPSRAFLKRHMNHDVRYVNKDGSIDE